MDPRIVDDDGMDEGQRVAIEAYEKGTGRTFRPGEIVPIATDALVFTEYQNVWPTIEEFKDGRCNWDEETNQWLVNYVVHEMIDPNLPPIYVDILEDGVALVDGVHRVSAHLIAGREIIWAQINS